MVLPPDAPQLYDLDLLLAVERRGSVGKAAREHRISQPAASLRLRTMERRIGVQLLDRSPSGSTLTDDGVVLARWARRAVEAVHELLACRSDLRNSSSGRLRIAGDLNIVEYLVPHWLGRLGIRLENIRVEVRAGTTTAILEQIREGQTDLGFVSGHAETRSDLAERRIGDDELVVVVGPAHPWRERTTAVSLHELAESRLILPERGSGTRELVEEWLAAAPSHESRVVLPSTTAIKQAVASASGAAILRLSTVSREVRDGRLTRVRVTGARPTTPVRAVWSTSRALNQVGQALLEGATLHGVAANTVPGHHECHRAIERPGPERGAQTETDLPAEPGEIARRQRPVDRAAARAVHRPSTITSSASRAGRPRGQTKA